MASQMKGQVLNLVLGLVANYTFGAMLGDLCIVFIHDEAD